jgi:hypothetical protein
MNSRKIKIMATVAGKPKKERLPKPKKPRNLSPASQQRYELEQLLAKPDQEITIPGKEKEPELLPPDILLNIQGSSAGAGSGEFHVYKAARKREYERIQKFEEEIEREESEKRFLKEREERQRLQREKSAKNRKRREKKKQRQNGEANGADGVEKKDKVGLKIPAREQQAEDGEIENGDHDDDGKEAPEGILIVEDDL